MNQVVIYWNFRNSSARVFDLSNKSDSGYPIQEVCFSLPQIVRLADEYCNQNPWCKKPTHWRYTDSPDNVRSLSIQGPARY